MRIDLAELPLVLSCLRCGFILGMVYDLLRIPRRLGRFASALADALFGCCFFGLTAATLLFYDSGRIRLFSIPLILAAFALWLFFPGKLLRLFFASVRSLFRNKLKKEQ
jgi:Spore cortex protein YabQ (Spore_YabQ).